MSPSFSIVEKGYFGAPSHHLPSEIPGLIPTQERNMREKNSRVKIGFNQQSLFTKPTKRAKAATEDSFSLSHLLTKHKKPFTNNEYLK